MKHRRGKPVRKRESSQALIYGFHAAEAALANPQRTITAAFATANTAARLADRLGQRGIAPQIVTPRDLERKLGADTVHQGILLEAAPLPTLELDDLPRLNLVLVLDQVTDPHNVGAMLRTAAAFGVDALVMTARHSPPLDGALAKAASGGLEHVPVVLVPNLARALDELAEHHIFCIGLDSDADAPLEDEPAHERLALVLGAEDRGLRRLTRERCDRLCALSAPGAIRSLNVSNAAAIALHHAWLKQRDASD